MNISISTTAITASNKKYFFREHTLWALKCLLDAGHQIQFNKGALSEKQHNLLEQEGIKQDTFANADLFIDLQGDLLVIKNNESQQITDAVNWEELVHYIQFPPRKANLKRSTKETDISISLNLDGTGKAEISTGLNFFDHMLEQIARHGLVDLRLTCDGDLEVDEHHTIEDVGIALGECISKALGNKKGIERYGFVLPMDETKAEISLDLSGRPYLVFEADFSREYVGDFPTEMTKHFFYSMAMNLKATLNINVQGENDHHKIEACFKGFARALKSAVEHNPRIINQIPSSKGSL